MTINLITVDTVRSSVEPKPPAIYFEESKPSPLVTVQSYSEGESFNFQTKPCQPHEVKLIKFKFKILNFDVWITTTESLLQLGTKELIFCLNSYFFLSFTGLPTKNDTSETTVEDISFFARLKT